MARRLVATATWAYLIGAIGAWGVLRFAGEAWWPATLLALGPRWVIATPLAILVPIVLLASRRSWRVLAIAAVVVVGPVMDLCVPWRRCVPFGANGGTLRVLTCNVHERVYRPAALAELIARDRPDVVALEEWNGWPAGAAPAASVVPGWHVATDFEIRVESRYPVRRVASVLAARGWAEGTATRFELDTPAGPVPLVVAHLASPHEAIKSVLTRRNDEAGDAVQDNAAMRQGQAHVLGEAARAAGPAVVCVGDMNLPSDAPAFRHGFAGLTDAFSTGGFGFGWTYRVKFTTTRIDHVLTGPAWRCRRCWVGPDIGSPHRPLIAELERVGP